MYLKWLFFVDQGFKKALMALDKILLDSLARRGHPAQVPSLYVPPIYL